MQNSFLEAPNKDEFCYLILIISLHRKTIISYEVSDLQFQCQHKKILEHLQRSLRNQNLSSKHSKRRESQVQNCRLICHVRKIVIFCRNNLMNKSRRSWLSLYSLNFSSFMFCQLDIRIIQTLNTRGLL